MLNKRPIFIVAFARGGSNILLNLLRSHPDACSPRGETQEVFKGKSLREISKGKIFSEESLATVMMKCLRYLPIIIKEGRDIFDINCWQLRKPFQPKTQERIDRILFDEKLRATALSQNYFKSEDIRYTREEISRARLLSKNLNGLIFLSPEFAKMYPDATFLALVRNGLAVCEGHIRRGANVDQIAKAYHLGCQQIIKDSKAIPNYYIFRYEDLIFKPQATFIEILNKAGLNPKKIKKVRLQATRVLSASGNHNVIKNKQERDLIWYELDEFEKHFTPDANENQIKQLSPAIKDKILQYANDSLRYFDYLN